MSRRMLLIRVVMSDYQFPVPDIPCYFLRPQSRLLEEATVF